MSSLEVPPLSFFKYFQLRNMFPGRGKAVNFIPKQGKDSHYINLITTMLIKSMNFGKKGRSLKEKNN